MPSSWSSSSGSATLGRPTIRIIGVRSREWHSNNDHISFKPRTIMKRTQQRMRRMPLLQTLLGCISFRHFSHDLHWLHLIFSIFQFSARQATRILRRSARPWSWPVQEENIALFHAFSFQDLHPCLCFAYVFFSFLCLHLCLSLCLLFFSPLPLSFLFFST